MGRSIEFLSLEEVAVKLNVHRRTIIRLIHAGQIEAADFGTRYRPAWRIPTREVDRFINERLYCRTSEKEKLNDRIGHNKQ
jgi:excisionase family DNA binding protein